MWCSPDWRCHRYSGHKNSLGTGGCPGTQSPSSRKPAARLPAVSALASSRPCSCRAGQAFSAPSDRPHPTPSSPQVALEPAPEQTDSRPHHLPYLPCPLAAPVAGLEAPAPASGSHRKIKQSRPPRYKRQHRKLGSWFLLQRFFLRHSLHDPDLGSLRIVRIGREVKQLGILPRTRGVEQILHHGQRSVVVLNHPCQK